MPSISVKGYWPQVEPAFWGIALFRWDISVRESAVLGLVGAGGIGMAIDTAMNLFQWERVALMLAAIFAVVIVAELVVTYIRKKIIRATEGENASISTVCSRSIGSAWATRRSPPSEKVSLSCPHENNLERAAMNAKRFAVIAGAVLITATIAAVLAIKAADLSTAPALGPAGLLYDLNVALNLLLVAGLTFGYRLARRGNYDAHQYNQTVWVLLNAVLVVLIMVSGLSSAKPETLSDLAKPHILVAWVHAALGTATVLSGLWLVLQMNDILPRRWHVRRWKTQMRLTLAGYWVVALLGFVIYYLWFV